MVAAHDADRVDPVAVPVPRHRLVTGHSERVCGIGRTAVAVRGIPGVAPVDPDGVDAVAVPVAGDRAVTGVPEAEGVVD